MQISKAKKDFIRQHYIARQLNINYLADKLRLQFATIRFYINEFRVLEKEHPEKLSDYSFFIGKDKVRQDTAFYRNFARVMPSVIAAEPGPVLQAEKLYQRYHAQCPDGYSRPGFYHVFSRWFDQHEKELSTAKLKAKFSPKELATLHKWRIGNDHRLWQVSVALTTVYTYNGRAKLAERIDCTTRTLRSWMTIYETKGLEALGRPGSKKPISPQKRLEIERKIDGLIHMVRQSPKLYGIDRVSWTITDLAYAYSKHTGIRITFSTVSVYLRRRGVRYKRSREVIVSNDPQYQEKYEHIQNVLSNLGKDEKFFSIDEYGPKSIRPQGGRMLAEQGKPPVYRKVDKGKGFIICTCALELSTNQLAWFYSAKKNTDEMIKLIEVLTLLYQDQKRLYLSWDAAAWHDSCQLLEYLAEVNDADYREKLKTPEIIIVPLPTKAPHLNVIESVFSGMAKSVVHNSDYQTVEECMEAIDRYFNKRNQFFLKHPKQAGTKLWGKEKIKAVFDKANICRPVG
ncbi:hypothetical protein GCM10023149_21810 [Mucilaginibacter gynuensis]|uniref:DDE superfamily endonuclease n=1 Tax=Mucilaginibacter gynuensis TaxID=1302236 RepID=A0ABP8GD66_9SPHI